MLSVALPCLCSRDLIAGCVDKRVWRFDIRVGYMYSDDFGAPVTGIAVSHDGNCVLGACMDSRLTLVDKREGDMLAQYTGKA